MIIRSVPQGNGVTKHYFALVDSAGVVHETGAVKTLDGQDVAQVEAEYLSRLNESLKHIELFNAVDDVGQGLNPIPHAKYNTRDEILKRLFDEYFTQSTINPQVMNAAKLIGLVTLGEIKTIGGYTDEQMQNIVDRITLVNSIATQMDGYAAPIEVTE